MPNHKRVYRAMKAHGLLLQRHAGGVEARRHDGRIAVDQSNLRWCSDGNELGCDNGEKVRVAFALDCCDREAMGHVATTEGIKADDACDLMVPAVEHRFGRDNRLPQTIEWLTDNGSCFIAGPTRRFAREIGLEPLTTPIQSPQSNGMAEAFVRTIKRDYARVNPMPSAEVVMRQLPAWFEHYSRLHPHKALGYRSPREFIADRSTAEDVSGQLGGCFNEDFLDGDEAAAIRLSQARKIVTSYMTELTFKLSFANPIAHAAELAEQRSDFGERRRPFGHHAIRSCPGDTVKPRMPVTKLQKKSVRAQMFRQLVVLRRARLGT